MYCNGRMKISELRVVDRGLSGYNKLDCVLLQQHSGVLCQRGAYFTHFSPGNQRLVGRTEQRGCAVCRFTN